MATGWIWEAEDGRLIVESDTYGDMVVPAGMPLEEAILRPGRCELADENLHRTPVGRYTITRKVMIEAAVMHTGRFTPEWAGSDNAVRAMGHNPGAYPTGPEVRLGA
jgi:hypothetical protein